MIGGCPECGATGSITVFVADPVGKEVCDLITKLPESLHPVVLPYLGLFRPAKRALTWARAKTLLVGGKQQPKKAGEPLLRLVACGHVQIDNQVARPCPPATWRAAIEQMLADQARIERPLKNHRYLCKVAYGLADAADAGAEKRRNEAERSGNSRAGAEDNGGNPMDRETVRREIGNFKQKMGW